MLRDGPRAKFVAYSEQKIWSANWIWLTIYIFFIKVGAISINQHQDSHCRNFIQQRGILYLDFTQVSVFQDSKWYKQCAKVDACGNGKM